MLPRMVEGIDLLLEKNNDFLKNSVVTPTQLNVHLKEHLIQKLHQPSNSQ